MVKPVVCFKAFVFSANPGDEAAIQTVNHSTVGFIWNDEFNQPTRHASSLSVVIVRLELHCNRLLAGMPPEVSVKDSLNEVN